MAWSRRWYVDSREKWRRILNALAEMQVDLKRHPVEIVVREQTQPKSDRQRALFHAACGDLAAVLGYWPGEMKMVIKLRYFGDDWECYSTEDLDHEHYGALIECLYATAADLGIVLPDRRTK